jgi:hypothetical protein
MTYSRVTKAFDLEYFDLRPTFLILPDKKLQNSIRYNEYYVTLYPMILIVTRRQKKG